MTLTADCTLTIEGWGGGGGGGGNVNAVSGGGGGGGGGTVVLDEAGTVWLVAGGGGGGGGGAGPGAPPGGGGGGGHAADVVTFAAGTRLTLSVGGGGDPGCNGTPGDGGAPDGGTNAGCEGGDATFGGAAGSAASCGRGGASTYGGGGGAAGWSAWGGAGGSDYDIDCTGASGHGGDGRCGPGPTGGGGGGGGALGATQELGQSGDHGGATSAGGAAPGGGAGGVAGATDGIAPGGGGAGAGACLAGAGADGALTLAVDVGPGAACPADQLVDCDGACAPARWYGDGVCDAPFDCDPLGLDAGDCPAVGPQLPSSLTAACPAVTAEPTFCFTGGDTDVGLVGLTSGAYCPLMQVPGATIDFENVAFVAPYRAVVACDDGVLAEFDLVLQSVRYAPVLCDNVSDHLGGLLVKGVAGYTWYATFDDALAGTGAAINPALSWDSFVASDGVALYWAYFSTDRVSRADVATGDALPDVLLEGFDERLDGFDLVDGALHVLRDEEVLRFDPHTGAALGTDAASGARFGLGCVTP